MFDEPFLKNTLTPILAIVGAVFGLLGTSIGLFNFYLSWRSHWVRVRLDWKHTRVVPSGGKDGYLHYETHLSIVNCSYFPITVREAGLVIKDSLFGRRRLIPCYGDGQMRFEARDGRDFIAVIGPP